MRQSPSGALTDDGSFIQQTFYHHLAPAMLSMFGVMASTMANTLITGNVLGADGLAAMSVVMPIYFVFATIGSLVGVGGSTLASHAIGRNRQADADGALTLSVVLAVGLALAVSALGLLFLDPILRLLGAQGNLYPMARAYSLIYVAGGVGTTVFYLPYNFLKLMGRLRLLTALFFGMAVMNVALDLLFLLPMGMGLAGVALGTVLASLITAVAGTVCLVRGPGAFHLVSLRGRGKDALRLMEQGSPSALNNLATVLRSMLLNRIVLSVAGSVGLAALSIVSTTANLSLTVLSGLPQATAPFVGVFTCQRDNTSLRQMEKLALGVGMGLMCVFAALVSVFAGPLCRLFGVVDPLTLAKAAHAVRLFAASLIAALPCCLLITYYQAGGHTGLANLMTVCRAFVFVVGPAWLLASRLGLSGVWAAFSAGEWATLLILGIVLIFCRKKGRYSPILLLDRNIEQNGAYISFAVKAESSAIAECAEQIEDFCTQNELSPKRTMLVSLSLEEMLTGIRDHCFPDEPQRTMDVRILVVPDQTRKDDVVVIRIRSGGPAFNPIAYYERRAEESPENVGDSLGIGMIVKAAEVVDYKSTFGVNNLTVML
ncbi:MAG: MATE family efflux transporter [Oscillibacter sp.]|jgi:Na+-driven multidrug efflux pump/anti-sigma regulatory factor (Ser/Thr protein kinase)|nr:MATE family efflux transporter [Oscillibacter sp.]